MSSPPEGLIGTISPSNPPLIKFTVTALPTFPAVIEAPITAIELGYSRDSSIDPTRPLNKDEYALCPICRDAVAYA